MRTRSFSWHTHYAHLRTLLEQTRPSVESFQRSTNYLVNSYIPPNKIPNVLATLAELNLTHNLISEVLYASQLRNKLIDPKAKQTWSLEDLCTILKALVQIKESKDTAVLQELFSEAVIKAPKGMNIQTAKDLLWVMTETRFVSFELVAAFEDMVEKVTFPAGLFDQSTTASVLNAYVQLRLEFDRLGPLLFGQVIPHKFQDFEVNYQIRVAYELAKLELWDPLLWRGIFKSLASADLKTLNEQSKCQSHHMMVILDLLAPKDFQPSIEALSHIRQNGLDAWDSIVAKKAMLTRLFAKPSAVERKIGKTVSSPNSPLDPSTTQFARNFGQIIANLGKSFIHEFITPGPYHLDVDILYGTNTVIELQGPLHYIRDSYLPTKSTVLKGKLLRKLDYEVFEVPFYVWDFLPEDKKISQVNRLLRLAQAR